MIQSIGGNTRLACFCDRSRTGRTGPFVRSDGGYQLVRSIDRPTLASIFSCLQRARVGGGVLQNDSRISILNPSFACVLSWAWVEIYGYLTHRHRLCNRSQNFVARADLFSPPRARSLPLSARASQRARSRKHAQHGCRPAHRHRWRRSRASCESWPLACHGGSRRRRHSSSSGSGSAAGGLHGGSRLNGCRSCNALRWLWNAPRWSKTSRTAPSHRLWRISLPS